MPKMIFVNLPVKHLERSMAFYEALGYANNKTFTDETAACMVISEEIYVMLLTHEKFAQFTRRPIADATKATEVINCLSEENRDAVDALFDKAISAGGAEAGDTMDYGMMYGRSFSDPDGHIWEVMWMDPSFSPN